MSVILDMASSQKELQFSEGAQSPYVGPARVIKYTPGRVQLDLLGREIWAQIALAYPYRPSEMDTVLVIGQDGAWYVIGVLNGNGKTTFTAPGDIEFRAPYGFINLVSAKGVSLRGPTVRVVAEKLDLISRNLIERCHNARRWVKNSLEVRAGRARTLIEDTYRIKAGRITERAQGDVKIDGRKIRLG